MTRICIKIPRSTQAAYTPYGGGYSICLSALPESIILQSPDEIASTSDTTQPAEGFLPGLLRDPAVLRSEDALYEAIASYWGYEGDAREVRRVIARTLDERNPEHQKLIDNVWTYRGKKVADYLADLQAEPPKAKNLYLKQLMQLFNQPIAIIGFDGRILNREDVDAFTGPPIFVAYTGIKDYRWSFGALKRDGLMEPADIFRRLKSLTDQPDGKVYLGLHDRFTAAGIFSKKESVAEEVCGIIGGLVMMEGVDGGWQSQPENKFRASVEDPHTVCFTGNLFAALTILQNCFLEEETYHQAVDQLILLRPARTRAEIRCYASYLQDWKNATESGRCGSRGPYRGTVEEDVPWVARHEDIVPDQEPEKAEGAAPYFFSITPGARK